MTSSGLVQFHPDLTSRLVDIDQISPHPDNYNNGDVDQIAVSIEVNGLYRPVYVQRATSYIVAGNHVWEACKTLGATVIPAVFLDVDEQTAHRIMVADNRIAALAKPDLALLTPILEELARTDSLLGTGYTDADLSALLALADIPPDYGHHETWPTLCFQIPPPAQRAFYRLTEAAVGENERLALLLRLAGWDGREEDAPSG